MKNSITKNLLWIWNIWKNHKKILLLLVGFGLLSGFVGTLSPYVLKKIIDNFTHFLKESPYIIEKEKVNFLLSLLGIGLLQLIANFYPGIRSIMNHFMEFTIRNLVFERLLNKTSLFFLKFHTGDILTRLTDDLTDFPKVSWFLCSGIFRAFNAFCILVGSGIVMIFISPLLALLSLGTLPLLILIFVKFQGQVKKTFEEKQKKVSKTTNHLESIISGIDILKAYNADIREAERFKKVLKERSEAEIEVIKIEAFFHSFFPKYHFLDNS